MPHSNVKVLPASEPFTIYVPSKRPPLFAALWRPRTAIGTDVARYSIQIDATLIPDWAARGLRPRIRDDQPVVLIATSERAPIVYPCNYEGKCEAAEVDWLVQELQRRDAQQIRRETLFDDKPLRLELNTFEYCILNYGGTSRAGTSLGLLSVSFPVSDHGWRLPDDTPSRDTESNFSMDPGPMGEHFARKARDDWE